MKKFVVAFLAMFFLGMGTVSAKWYPFDLRSGRWWINSDDFASIEDMVNFAIWLDNVTATWANNPIINSNTAFKEI